MERHRAARKKKCESRNLNAEMKDFYKKYRKEIIITASVIILQLIFGFDPKFCIINIVWLLV